MFDRVECKARAKEQLKGHWFPLFLCTLIPGVIYGVLECVPYVGPIAGNIIMPVLSAGMIVIYLNHVTGAPYEMAQLFALRNYWWKAFCLSFRMGLRIFLWSLLFVVPGFIAAYRYSLVMYIFAEDPSLDNTEILDLSSAMTDGHKWDLFKFGLSFLGWLLLCCVTCGIAGIWVFPYINASMANVYCSMRKS